MSDNLNKEMQFAAHLARKAGTLTLKYFQTGVETRWKADASPVTVADVEGEKLVRSLIAKEFPADAVVGEEEADRAGTSGRTWFVDPIDGTKSFIQGVPLYGVLIGLTSPEGPLAGAIAIPALGDLVYAARGEGCFSKDAPARVSKVKNLKDACVVYTSARNFDRAGPRFSRAREDLRGQARMMRGWGDAYGYVLVATGRADAMFDPLLNPWDAAPMIPILEEAGGRFSDWDGAARIDGGNGIASNGLLHDEILGLAKA